MKKNLTSHRNAVQFTHLSKFILVAIIFAITSCSVGIKKESPVIYFSNSSYHAISDIRCSWSNNNILTLPKLNPGDSRAQSFYIKNYSDFFGPIIITWINADGEKLSEEFNFRAMHLPSIADTTTYNYVQLYFFQDGLSVMTSDAPNLASEVKRMDGLLRVYSENFKTKNSVPATALIRVEPQKDHSVPVWLSTSY